MTYPTKELKYSTSAKIGQVLTDGVRRTGVAIVSGVIAGSIANDPFPGAVVTVALLVVGTAHLGCNAIKGIINRRT
jgi:hypothetical protein